MPTEPGQCRPPPRGAGSAATSRLRDGWDASVQLIDLSLAIALLTPARWSGPAGCSHHLVRAAPRKDQPTFSLPCIPDNLQAIFTKKVRNWVFVCIIVGPHIDSFLDTVSWPGCRLSRAYRQQGGRNQPVRESSVEPHFRALILLRSENPGSGLRGVNSKPSAVWPRWTCRRPAVARSGGR